MNLHHDYTRCLGEDCERKNQCLRHTVLFEEKLGYAYIRVTGTRMEQGECRLFIGPDGERHD